MYPRFVLFSMKGLLDSLLSTGIPRLLTENPTTCGSGLCSHLTSGTSAPSTGHFEDTTLSSLTALFTCVERAVSDQVEVTSADCA